MPKGLRQEKIARKVAARQKRLAEQAEDITVTTEPDVQHHEEKTKEEHEAHEELAEVPKGESFPFHKGGGYYVLSNGKVIRGEDKAENAQEELDREET